MIRWLYDHYVITGVIASYYLVLVGYGTYQVFSQVIEITAAGATVYATLMALPAAVAAILKWRFEKDAD